MKKKLLAGLATGLVMLGLAGMSYAAPTNHTVYLASGGSLNGQTVDTSNYFINVNPNELISGSINIDVYNGSGPNGVVPVAGTVTWGERAAQPWLIDGWISPGWNTLSANVNITAPNTPGLYHIIIANTGEFTAGNIMSSTNWSAGPDIWNDGNDMGWDWTADQFNQARTDGTVWENRLFPEGYGYTPTGATWVGVEVNNPVPVPAAVWLLGSGLVGLAGLRRKKK